ncbi:MAG TPA: hypothetical protein VKP13_09840 [Nitrospira sp.]|nr:hypothetical protein [Nitrospira sp.]
MATVIPNHSLPKSSWIRIPDGTKVRHRHEALEGVIDGLTELVTGPERNPDGRTQYRVNIGEPTRHLMIEDDLCILLDRDDLVIMLRQKEPYRRCVTESLRGVFSDDRFIKCSGPLEVAAGRVRRTRKGSHG